MLLKIVLALAVTASPITAEKPDAPGWLSERQMSHAVTIVETGQAMDLPKRAYVVAIATAMQESRISVLANTGNPKSYEYDGVDGQGQDHDSVGIFQQRPKFWCPGDLYACMEPESSSKKFYAALKRVGGWQDMPVTRAAQSVQGSAYPDAYAKHVDLAQRVVAEVLEWQEEQKEQKAQERREAQEREEKEAREKDAERRSSNDGTRVRAAVGGLSGWR